ncbi:MAG: class I SAM-dependent methyltransferase [Gemmatimonadota bacterium]|nr:class I SAM-dependent methyltransferase [Gemmatimonadota bacterium]
MSHIWRCPRCRGQLRAVLPTYTCVACDAEYCTIDGIPDFRIDAPSWIDCDEDRAHARFIADSMAHDDLEHVIRYVFRVVRQRPDANVEYRARRTLSEPTRVGREITGWLNQATRATPFLDVGCGPGALLAAAGANGRQGIGIDVSMVWLVVAKRLIESYGGVALLAAGFAETLPLPDDSVGGVVSLDVIEHVGDPAVYLREIDRVTAPGGALALATPNRFSLAPEPHVRVWGVGWLPRPWQQAYAERMSGMSYAYVRLLAAREMQRLIRDNTAFDVCLVAPLLPDEEVAIAGPVRAAFARVYNALLRYGAGRRAALYFGAFYRVIGTRRDMTPAR